MVPAAQALSRVLQVRVRPQLGKVARRIHSDSSFGVGIALRRLRLKFKGWIFHG